MRKPKIVLVICIALLLLTVVTVGVFHYLKFLRPADDPADIILASGNETESSETIETTQGHSSQAITDEPELTVTVLNVGQGSACILKASNGDYAVIDTGDSEHAQVPVAILKQAGVTKVKYAIATHWDADHCAGLPGILRNFSCETVIGAGYEADTRTYQNVKSFIATSGINFVVPYVGQEFTLGSATITCVGPVSEYEEENAKSLCFLIRCGKTSVWIAGDATSESEEASLKTKNLNADVLIVDHHGSSSSTSAAFVSALRPKYAIISCDKNSGYGHPTKKVLSVLSAANVKLYRTDDGQDVCFSIQNDEISFFSPESTNWEPGMYNKLLFN